MGSKLKKESCKAEHFSTSTKVHFFVQEGKDKMTEEPEAFRDSRFTAEISNRMRVPDRIMVAGESQTRSPAFTGVNGPTAVAFSRDRDHVNDKFEMQVPERILVAGRDQHINAGKKSTPFEMQVENAVLPPTWLEVRVNTPPRNIRLDDHNFPNAQSEDDLEGTIEGDDSLNETQDNNSRTSTGGVSFRKALAGKIVSNRSASVESESYNLGMAGGGGGR